MGIANQCPEGGFSFSAAPSIASDRLVFPIPIERDRMSPDAPIGTYCPLCQSVSESRKFANRKTFAYSDHMVR